MAGCTEVSVQYLFPTIFATNDGRTPTLGPKIMHRSFLYCQIRTEKGGGSVTKRIQSERSQQAVIFRAHPPAPPPTTLHFPLENRLSANFRPSRRSTAHVWRFYASIACHRLRQKFSVLRRSYYAGHNIIFNSTCRWSATYYAAKMHDLCFVCLAIHRSSCFHPRVTLLVHVCGFKHECTAVKA